jgi:hypothetical protein
MCGRMGVWACGRTITTHTPILFSFTFHVFLAYLLLSFNIASVSRSMVFRMAVSRLS